MIWVALFILLVMGWAVRMNNKQELRDLDEHFREQDRRMAERLKHSRKMADIQWKMYEIKCEMAPFTIIRSGIEVGEE